MTNNEILKTLQNILCVDVKMLHKIFLLAGYEITLQRVEGYLKEKDDKAFLDCGAEALGHFLDGMIIYKRGSSDKKSEDTVTRLSNNLILKKLRIAFDLKEVDLFAIFEAIEIDITKSELNALFRNESHKKFRLCPDSILQLFLEGLESLERR